MTQALLLPLPLLSLLTLQCADSSHLQGLRLLCSLGTQVGGEDMAYQQTSCAQRC